MRRGLSPGKSPDRLFVRPEAHRYNVSRFRLTKNATVDRSGAQNSGISKLVHRIRAFVVTAKPVLLRDDPQKIARNPGIPLCARFSFSRRILSLIGAGSEPTTIRFAGCAINRRAFFREGSMDSTNRWSHGPLKSAIFRVDGGWSIARFTKIKLKTRFAEKMKFRYWREIGSFISSRRPSVRKPIYLPSNGRFSPIQYWSGI